MTDAAERGVLGVTELGRFDLANYSFALRAVAGSAFFRAFYGARDIAVADLSRADYIEKRRTPWKLRPEKKRRAAGASREGADK